MSESAKIKAIDIVNPDFLREYNLPANWRIVIKSNSEEEIPLTVVIGFGEELEIIHSTTPFEFEFKASNFTALIKSKLERKKFTAENWSDVFGEFRHLGGFSSSSTGKFTFNPVGPTTSSAGSTF